MNGRRYSLSHLNGATIALNGNPARLRDGISVPGVVKQEPNLPSASSVVSTRPSTTLAAACSVITACGDSGSAVKRRRIDLPALNNESELRPHPAYGEYGTSGSGYRRASHSSRYPRRDNQESRREAAVYGAAVPADCHPSPSSVGKRWLARTGRPQLVALAGRGDGAAVRLPRRPRKESIGTRSRRAGHLRPGRDSIVAAGYPGSFYGASGEEP